MSGGGRREGCSFEEGGFSKVVEPIAGRGRNVGREVFEFVGKYKRKIQRVAKRLT